MNSTIVLTRKELQDRLNPTLSLEERPRTVAERLKINRVLQRRNCTKCKQTTLYMLNQRMLENINGMEFAIYNCTRCGTPSLDHIRGE